MTGWVSVPDRAHRYEPDRPANGFPMAGLSGERGTRYSESRTVTGCSLGKASGATAFEVVEAFVRCYLEEPRNMQYTDFGHKLMFRSGSDAFWHRFSERATFATTPKGFVSKRGRPFMWENMNLSNPKFRYKGSKPFWLWTTGEWLFYTSLMIVGWVIIILNDL